MCSGLDVCVAFGSIHDGISFELPFSLIQVFVEAPLNENRGSFSFFTMVSQCDFHLADENRWNLKIDVTVNREGFHHMDEI